MKKLFIGLVVLLVISAFTFIGCAGTSTSTSTSAPPSTSSSAPPSTSSSAPATAAIKPVQLIWSTPGGEQDYSNVITRDVFQKMITDATNGAVTFKYYYGGALIAAGATYDGVVNKVTDIGYDQPSYNKGRFPTIELLEQPWGYPNPIVANKVALDVFKTYNPKEIQDTHFLYTSSFGHPVLISNKAIRSLADLKGMKIRGTGNMANMISAMGASAVSMPIFEVYDALSKGTVEGAMLGPETMQTYKFTEVIKYATDVSFIGPNMLTSAFMNLQTWNSLDPKVQDLFNKMGDYLSSTLAQATEDKCQEAYKYAQDHSVHSSPCKPTSSPIARRPCRHS